MSLITCGLSDEGVIAAVIPFATTTYLTVFDETRIEVEFTQETLVEEFQATIPVVEFEIDVIRIEECSWPAV